MPSLKQGLPHAAACLATVLLIILAGFRSCVICILHHAHLGKDAEAQPGVDPMTGIAYYTPGTQFVKGSGKLFRMHGHCVAIRQC